MDSNKIDCPICSKEFSSAIIESHVSKCLFLNESASNESSTSFKDGSPVKKLMKLSDIKAKKRNSGMIKRKSNLIESTSSSTDIESPNISCDSSIDKKVKKPFENDRIPLAERMRPTTLTGYVGQAHILGPSTVLFQLLHKSEIPNIILWGPPGCGKTSLANVIAYICKNKSNGKMRYVKLSAAMAGVNEVKEVITVASNELKFDRRTVVFMDEIHRFNKAQQDVFLPHVESGIITLIGATTENPSFSLNSALLSRCRVIVLEKLTVPNLISILNRAVLSIEGIVYTSNRSENIEKVPKFIIDEPTIEWLAGTCDGDARIALGGLELAIQCKIPNEEEFLKTGSVIITLDDIKESLKKTHMLYDKKGDQHYDMISALHKSVRASDENASLYWLTRMILGGEDRVYIARRLVRMACEDIGLEDPKALGIAIHTMHGCKMIGMPECDVLLAQCTTYLARAPKSRLMEDALRAAQRVVAEHKGPQPGVPLHLRNAPTKLMKTLGYGKDYNMKQKDESGLNYLPEGLEHVNFFE